MVMNMPPLTKKKFNRVLKDTEFFEMNKNKSVWVFAGFHEDRLMNVYTVGTKEQAIKLQAKECGPLRVGRLSDLTETMIRVLKVKKGVMYLDYENEDGIYNKKYKKRLC